MEFLGFLFEAVVGILDLIAAGLDIYSWLKGKENRVERREAKKAGDPVPSRDKWNVRVVILTMAVCILTLVLVIALGNKRA